MRIVRLALIASACAGVTSAFCQQSVTTQGGNINSVPLFSGGATLTNSAITQVNGQVAIGAGANAPVLPLDVRGANQGVTAAGYVNQGSLWIGDGSTAGMSVGNLGNGSFLQAHYLDNAQVYRFLLLNPSGGSVGIGSINPQTTLNLSGSGLLANGKGLLIGTLGDPINTQVPVGTEVGRFEIGFPGWRDVQANQIGAKIASIRRNNYLPNSALIQSSDLAFFTGSGVDGAAQGNILDITSERMRITSNGFVGIGTANPNAALEVNGSLRLSTNSGGTLTFADGSVQSTAATSSPSNLSQSNGNVGIGTTTPQSILQINSPQLSVSSNNNPWGGGNLTIQASGTSRTPMMGAALSFAVPANTDGANPWEQARIMAVPDNSNTTDASGRMLFQTRSLIAGVWAWQSNLMLTANGNVGVGMNAVANQTPGAALEVNGNVKLTTNSGASITFPDNTVQSTAWNGTTIGGDYAEAVDVQGDRKTYEVGDLIVIDDLADGKFNKSAKAYSRMVAGVYSTKPGLVGRRTTVDRPNEEAEVPMAMMGIVPTKVCADNGPIERGDLLVSSSTLGYAMKGTDSSRMIGAVIGKALAPFKVGYGVIEVLVSLQ